MDRVRVLMHRKPVVIFSLSSCCMCHTVKRLFSDLAVDADIHELDEEPEGKEMQMALANLIGRNPPTPVVFIGGILIGSTDRVMSLHLTGNLVRMLRDAGAIWL